MSKQANQFDLSGKGYRISYATTSIAGVPLFQFEGHGVSHSFKGEEIRAVDTELGTLVTVTLETVPDLETVTFSVVLPAINMREQDQQVEFDAVGIHATHRTSIGGPTLIDGALSSYRSLDLSGQARSVVS